MITGIPRPGDWTLSALCAQVDPALFFPEKGGIGGQAAKRICARCAVRDQCLDYALEHGDLFGIFGGLSERERRPLLAARREAA